MSAKSLIHEILTILNPGWDYDEKPRGAEYAGKLKDRLGKIRENYLGHDIDGCEADIITPTLTTIKEVSLAILEGRITVAQLEPEISSLDHIMEWLWSEFRSGRLSLDHPEAQDALSFGSALIEFRIPRRRENGRPAIAAQAETHDTERSPS